MPDLDRWVNGVHCGDSLEMLKQMPAGSVSCCMFSPPYFGLRDYKVDGQIGLEKDFNGWLAKMWAVMDEIWRVGRPDMTVWVNLGDGYGGSNSRASFGGRAGFGTEREGVYRKPLKKSLLMLPERFALGCIERDINDEYELRNDLTVEEKEYVLLELKKVGIDADTNHNKQ